MQAKPVLEMIRIPMFRVHCADLEAFIQLVYRSQEVDFKQAAGLTAGMIPEYKVDGQIPKTGDWHHRVQWIRSGKRVTKHAALVLNLLACDGFIPKGTYIIDTNKRPEPIEVYKHLLQSTGSPASETCVAFKTRNTKDKTFVQRAELVDKVWTERYQQA